jgi:hypothetical protein
MLEQWIDFRMMQIPRNDKKSKLKALLMESEIPKSKRKLYEREFSMLSEYM